jgi:DnaJ-domain-containing protein 1
LFGFSPEIRLYVIVAVSFFCGWIVVGKIIEYYQDKRTEQNGRQENQDPPRPEPEGFIGTDGPYAEHFYTLGISPTWDFEVIKRAYHDKVKQYHPDKTAGLAQEFHDLAVTETQKINRAYAALKMRQASINQNF